MAIYSVEACLCPESGFCRSAGAVVIDDTLNQLQVGSTYYLSGNTGKDDFEGCFYVENLEPSMGTPNTIILDSYGPVGCEQCELENANFLIFQECFVDGGFGEIYIPIGDFTGTPSLGDVFLLSFYFGYYGNLAQYTGCFEFAGFSVQGGDFTLILTSQTPKTGCQNCLETSPIIYRVEECTTQTTYFIAFPSTGFEDHLITFTDLSEITQFCGRVIEQQTQPTSGILIADLGVFNEETNNCETCLENVAEKRKIVNCLNPSSEEIVWASTLFEAGQSTHLSNGDGCYQISEDVVPPESAVTLNDFADFVPQENCEDCFECYGLGYDFVTCEPIEVCGPINLINANPLNNGRDFAIDTNDFAFVPFYNNKIGKFNLSTQSFVTASTFTFNLSCPTSLDIDESNGVICVSNDCLVGVPPFNDYGVTFVDYTDIQLTSVVFLNNRIPTKVYYNQTDGFFYVTTNNIGFPGGSIIVFSASSYSSTTQITNFGFTNNQYVDIVQVGPNIYTLNRGQSQLEIYSTSPGPPYTYLGAIPLISTPTSLSYDGGGYIYIMTDDPEYLKFDISTSGVTNILISYDCWSGSQTRIKVNNSTNKIYITDTNCNAIYEFDRLTDIQLKTYDNNILNSPGFGISVPFGIDFDSSNNPWFSSYEDLFSLGCTNEIVSGNTQANEYLLPGQVFFNTQLSACCEITQVQNLGENDFFGIREYTSMLEYEDCETCTGTTHELWYCQSCNGGFFSGVLTAPAGSYTTTDIVRAHWGNSHFLCFEVIEPYTNQVTDFSFESEGEPAYTTCEECSSGLTVGLTIVNCDTLVSQQVNVTQEDWLQIAGFPFSTPFFVFSDEEGNCYQVVNACPIDNDNPLFNIENFYINQFFCKLANEEIPLTPITAGTPYEACLVCCPCESGSTITSVPVPHPTWTNQYGRAIVQANMVLLGGNGLNS